MMKILLLSIIIFLKNKKYSLSILIIPSIMLITLMKMSFNKMIMNSMMNIDILSMMLIILSLMSTLLIIISSNILKKISFLMMSILTNLLILFSLNNIFSFYILFELILIPTMILITKFGNQPERLQAGIYLIIYTVSASLPLLMNIISMKNNYSFIFMHLMMLKNNMIIFMMLAFLVKMPMFFTHLWLPKAHVEAPLEGSMILAAILLKLGGYGLIRIYTICLHKIHHINYWMMSISMMGASITSLMCIRQKDMKSLIAYSSVAHMALTLASLFSSNPMGLMGAIMMMIAHAFSSSALFLLVNDLYFKMHSRNIILFKGLMSITPNITFWWFMFMAANISAPPSINTISEIMIITSLMTWNMMMLIMILLSSILTASFSMSIFINIIHNKNEMLPIKSSNHKTMLSLFSHFIPMIFLLMKMEMFYI
uniref:NADH-ubiquinone oxidoreductase chain 4 n=1 Tax=Desis jiaxiangi TaxID=2789892 RepID=A0A8B0ZAB9_9ARAC|nr:NADH dehydrogenase subunit 4 [Desis jiaxiangi]QTX95132.1 NADH dehydrogenase subunit 4 [Desis jiaxiangi]